jgi:hypothetical protein
MARLSDWLKKNADRVTEVLLGSDLQSRLCAHIDMICARSDGVLPTRFRIEMEQALFDEKTTEYRRRTGTDVDDLERELAEVARRHMLGKGAGYRTYADTVTVKVEPHVMVSGVRIVADFPAEKKIATVLSAESTARSATNDDVKLETIAKPVAANFDGRSLETVVVNPDRPSGGLETRVISPNEPPEADPPPAAGLETRVIMPDDTPEEVEPPSKSVTPPSADTGMETRVYDPGAAEISAPAEASPEPVDSMPPPADAGMETRVFMPDDEEPPAQEPPVISEMAIVVEQPVIRQVLVLLEPDESGDYQESETWVLEMGRSYTIGRSRKNDIVITVGTVSRHHALVRLDVNGDTFISDTGSSHGTFVDDQRINDERRIEIGDDIQLTQQGAAHLTLQPMGS